MAFILTLCVLVGAPTFASAKDVPHQLKAAYLYNFAKLTYWSATAEQGKPFIICTSASDQFTQTLKALSNKPVAGRHVQVVALGAKSQADFCDMVFVDKYHSEAWYERGVSSAQGKLIVGEAPGFIEQGGVINFYLEGDKLRFEVSINNAERNGLQISSRLLKLARVVEANHER